MSELPDSFSERARFLASFRADVDEKVAAYYSPAGSSYTSKADNSRVTKADTELNDVVIERTREAYPDWGVIGEEASNDNDSKTKLIDDPIDGTKMFTIGLPLFAFQAAILEDGQPETAIIYNPLARRTLVAEKGKGTWLMEAATYTQVSEATTLEGEIYDSGWSDKERAVTNVLWDKGALTSTLYSVAEVTSLVAIGGLVGGHYVYDKPWDMAPGKLIIEEACGNVTTLDGKTQRYDGTIDGALYSNGHLHDELLRIIRLTER